MLRQRFAGVADIDVILEALKSIAWDILQFVGGGAAIGGIAGFILGGVGTGPGAVAGGALGLAVLTVWGLADIAEYVIEHLPPALDLILSGFKDAWAAGETLDPDPQVEQRELNQAAWKIAYGSAEIITEIIAGCLMLITARGASVAFKILRKTRLGTAGARWLTGNAGALQKVLARRNVPESDASQHLESGSVSARRRPDDGGQQPSTTKKPEQIDKKKRPPGSP